MTKVLVGLQTTMRNDVRRPITLEPLGTFQEDMRERRHTNEENKHRDGDENNEYKGDNWKHRRIEFAGNYSNSDKYGAGRCETENQSECESRALAES
jgi:hypothetical protein